MGLGAAMIGAAGIGLIGSGIQASASQQAAQQQASADQAALTQQKQMFKTASSALNPYITAGESVLPTLSALETPGTSASTLATLPGFQFQSEYGNLQATNQLAAEGLGGSAGPVGKALSDYNQGLASTYYQNYTNALQNYANMGSGAASALAGDAISSGNSQAATLQSQGNALAAGTLGSASAISGGLTSAANSMTNSLLLSKLLGGGSGSSSIYGNMNLGNIFGTNSIGMPNF